MRFTCLLALAAVVSASPLSLDHTRTIERRGNLPEPVDAATAKEYLAKLTVAGPVTKPPYDRTKFRHWITISGKCDTRETVLKRDSIIDVTVDAQCRPTVGSWISDYDGEVVTDPKLTASTLDIDNIVPLKEAWQAGAWNWTAERRKEFANDLIRPQLLAVSARSNRMKGDKDPSKWMPLNAAYHCTYIRAWIQIKHYYGLNVDETEKAALTEYINEC
ncbi:hypothetical protein FRC11_004311 [Ceratobasidium sp. 423]|nr:hypothetical protein FRC11_004311 [Ceratobasidium sp. 423]